MVLRKSLQKFLVIFLFLFVFENLFSLDYFSWDFSDCEIKDILFAVSLDTGLSIVPDDTVSGKADLKFNGTDFEKAFDAFLSGSRLYVEKSENLWTVSRFKFVREFGEAGNDEVFSLDVCDLLPVQIIEKLSVVLNSVVTFDELPVQRISVHFKKLDENSLMENLAKRFGSYEVLVGKGTFSFVRKIEQKRITSSEEFINFVVGNDGLLKLDAKAVRLSDVLEKIFDIRNDGNTGYCLPVGSDVKIARINIFSENFDELLKKLCFNAGFNFTRKENEYYFYPDNEMKNHILFGEKKWKRFDLKYTKVPDFLSLVSKRLGNVEISQTNDDSFFYGKVNNQEEIEILQLIKEVDVKKDTFVLSLKYIKPKDFMEHLPPFVDQKNLFVADDSSCIYFKGTEAAYRSLCEQVEICDRPEPRITYDLLIMQYDESVENVWSCGIGAGMLSLGDRNALSVQLGSVMSLNLNVISVFGLKFAANLQSSIEENKANVFVDTTLHGISGKEINFQNTNTYRYRDNNLDPETGKPIYSGITKEISSGIKIDVTGWVSGDGMITSYVTASVSRQGNDTSGLTGNPPPTTEKVVTTEVCGKSGEPVILSGLVQKSENQDVKRLPIISKIPILGNLFKTKQKITEKSQMVIYLIPHIDNYDSSHILNQKEKTKQVIEKYQKLISTLEFDRKASKE